MSSDSDIADQQGPPETKPASPKVRLLTSWKLWTILLVLALVGIGVAISLPIVRRVQALRYFDEHKPAAWYGLSREHEDWPEKYGEWTNSLRQVDAMFHTVATDETLRHLATLSEVASVSLTGNNSQRFRVNEFSTPLTRLEELHLVGQCFTDDLIADMLACRPPLTTLLLIDTGAGERTLAAASRIPSLVQIVIHTRNQRDDVFQGLAPIPNLWSFKAMGGGDHCAEWLAQCPNITHALISYSSLTDAGLRRLTTCKKIESLYLHETFVTNNGLQHLGDLVLLERLQLYECCELLPEGIVKLPQLPQLDHLVISPEMLTRERVEHLRQLPYIGSIAVYGEIVDLEIRELADAELDLQVSPAASDEESWQRLNGTRQWHPAIGFC